jgi:arylsulfatase A
LTRAAIKWLTIVVLCGVLAPGAHAAGPPAREPRLAVKAALRNAAPPNIVFIVADDLGYGDLGCYGGRVIGTPHIDRLAAEGVRFTDFYACAAVCAPARAGLLTGRYPLRSGVIGNPYPAEEPLRRRLARGLGNLLHGLGVVDIREQTAGPGLPARELTLAEALKQAGYRTGMVGKWHLGDFSQAAQFNPRRHGFDAFFGVPHSNDMRPFPLYRDENEVEADMGLNQARLTGLYTREAIAFIEAAGQAPFFLYLAHTFPHQPLFASAAFAGRSAAGKYGDAVAEIDWSVGQILDTLAQQGIDRRTLIFFLSDNGPWFEGSPGGLRGRKGQSYEGGFRVPLLVRGPGRLPAGRVIQAPAMNIDLFPTVLDLVGLALPTDRIVDGRSLWAEINGAAAPPVERALYFYHYDQLEGLRLGNWKYLRQLNRYVWPVPLDTALVPDRLGGDQLGRRWPLLYDLARDPGENYNVIDRDAALTNRLARQLADWEREIRENPQGWR